MKLTFNAEKHEYKLGDRILPSVTSILKDLGLINDAHFTEYATDRGSKVHRACLYYDEGNLDNDSLDHELEGYLDAYCKFKRNFPSFRYITMETPFHDEQLGFAGTPDRTGETLNEVFVLDIKTSSTPLRWIGLQLAAYMMLTKCPIAYSLRLSPKGKWALDSWNDPNSMRAWKSALNLYNWKHGG